MLTEEKRHIFSIIMGGIGIILFWRGIWEFSARFLTTEVVIVIGVAMLLAAAIVERKNILRYIHTH